MALEAGELDITTTIIFKGLEICETHSKPLTVGKARSIPEVSSLQIKLPPL